MFQQKYFYLNFKNKNNKKLSFWTNKKYLFGVNINFFGGEGGVFRVEQM